MSEDINLDQKLEYKGYWYLPSAPELKIAGFVTYYPNEKITLELIGAFDEEIETLFSDKNEPVIYGETSDAKDISLIHCYQYSSLNFAAGFPIVRYTCNYMIIGKYIMSLEEKSYYCASFNIPELSFWCHPAAINYTVYSDEKEQETKKLCLSFISTDFQSKNDIICSVDINEDTSIFLKRRISYNETTYRLKAHLEQYTYVEIVRKKKSSILDFLSNIHIYEDFISLATLSTVKSSEITLFDNELYEQVGEKKFYKSINIIHPYSDREDFLGGKKQDYLFDYLAIKDIYPDILKAWFNAPSDLYPIRLHLIDSLKQKKVFGSVDFLILIQAVEGFWWRFRDKNYRLTNTISKKVTTSLNTIMTELVNEFKDVELLTKASIDIDAVVDSRHYYSHFLPKSKKPKTLEGITLFKESKKLRVLLICCILSFMGLNNSQINDIFKKSNSEFL